MTQKSGLGFGGILIGIGVLSLVLPLCNLQFTVTKGIGIATGLPLACISIVLIVSGVIVMFIGQARGSVNYSGMTLPKNLPSYNAPIPDHINQPNPASEVSAYQKSSVSTLNPYAVEILNRLNENEPLEQVIESISQKTSVREEYVAMFIVALLESLKKHMADAALANKNAQTEPEDEIPF